MNDMLASAEVADTVTFDARQQEKVNALIRDAQGRAAKNLREELNRVKTELHSLQSKAAAETHSDSQEELQTARETIAQRDSELSQTNTELRSLRRDAAIRRVASVMNWHDPEAVVRLTRDSIDFDEAGQPIVVNQSGSRRLSPSTLEPMGIKEYLRELAATNPWLVRETTKDSSASYAAQRAASSSGRFQVDDIFGPKSDSAKANRLAKEDKQEYMRLRKIAIEKRLISG